MWRGINSTRARRQAPNDLKANTVWPHSQTPPMKNVPHAHNTNLRSSPKGTHQALALGIRGTLTAPAPANCIFLFSWAFSRRLVAQDENKQTSLALDRLPDKERRMLNQLNTSSQQRAQKEINAQKLLSLKNPHSKRTSLLLYLLYPLTKAPKTS